MTALTASNIVVVPIRTGVGLRLGRQCRLSQIHAHGDLEPVLSQVIRSQRRLTVLAAQLDGRRRSPMTCGSPGTLALV